MNENINLVEILKDAPEGTKLWSPLCGECKFCIVDTFSDFPIKVSDRENNFVSFLSDGRYTGYIDGECLLFPSKDNRDWSTFKAPRKHKIFEPFQKVMVATIYFGAKIWCADLYGHYDEMSHTHSLVGCSKVPDGEVIPFKGNEYKLGKPVNQ